MTNERTAEDSKQRDMATARLIAAAVFGALLAVAIFHVVAGTRGLGFALLAVALGAGTAVFGGLRDKQ